MTICPVLVIAAVQSDVVSFQPHLGRILLTDERTGEDSAGEALQSGCRDRLPHEHPGRPGEQLALQATHRTSTTPAHANTHRQSVAMHVYSRTVSQYNYFGGNIALRSTNSCCFGLLFTLKVQCTDFTHTVQLPGHDQCYSIYENGYKSVLGGFGGSFLKVLETNNNKETHSDVIMVTPRVGLCYNLDVWSLKHKGMYVVGMV